MQAESGGHNSDSAEEVAWVPERHANPSHLPPSPMAKAVGPECAAAVNLLCMSVHENAAKQAAQVQQQRSSPGNALREVPKASGHPNWCRNCKDDNTMHCRVKPGSLP